MLLLCGGEGVQEMQKSPGDRSNTQLIKKNLFDFILLSLDLLDFTYHRTRLSANRYLLLFFIHWD